MKKKVKQILSALLVAVMLVGIAPVGGIDFTPKAKAMDLSSYKVGDIIEFGSYPQSEVKDSDLIAKIEAAGASISWIDYNYYAGTGSEYDGNMKPVKDMMLYKDITYNGNKYRAVKINQYRPYYTGYKSSASHTSQDDNSYYTGNVYYFKYEPLTWRVLDPNEGYVICTKAIDSQAYQNYIYKSGEEYYNSKDCKKFASDWATSSLRDWLNNSFYNTSFSDTEKSYITLSHLENKSTYISKYDSKYTDDNIFIISYYDAINSTYGFNSNEEAHDTKRQMKGTDYAKCQGLYANENAEWWLRSPYISKVATEVYSYGAVNSYWYDHYVTQNNGIVPAFKFNSKASNPYELKAWVASGSNSIRVGDTDIVSFELRKDGNTVKNPKITVSVSDNSVLETNIESNGYETFVNIKAKKAGVATITAAEAETGIVKYYNFTAINNLSGYDFENYPQSTEILKGKTTNFYDWGGLYVDSLNPTKNSDGSYNVTMDIYNSKNINGAVVSYYKDGSICDYQPIARFDSYASSIYDVAKSAINLPGQVKDLFSKYTIYTNENLTEKTSVWGESAITVPEGGYIQITNNMSDSTVCALYNITDFAISTAFILSKLAIAQADLSKKAGEAAKLAVKEILKDAGKDAIETLSKEITKKLAEGISYKNIDEFVGIVDKALRNGKNHLDYGKIMKSCAQEVGISVSETVIEKLFGPFGEALGVMFKINGGVSYLDYSLTMCKSDRFPTICMSAKRNRNEFEMNGVTVNTKGNVDNNTIVRVFKVLDDSQITINLSQNRYVEKSTTYDIYMVKDNQKVQPNGKVVVSIPIPEGYDAKNCVIMRQEKDGSWTEFKPTISGKLLVIETDHFSYYSVVQVSKSRVRDVSVSDITLNYKKSTTIKPTIKADEGAKYTVKYSSSNTKVATVDENGKVYAAKRGSATITCTVTDSNGNTVQDTCKVTVKYSFGQWLIKILLFGWIWY